MFMVNYSIPSVANFKGNREKNKMHGFGVFLGRNGREYEGMYSDDRRNSFGVFIWPKNQTYEGVWSDGRSHRLGTYTSSAGNIKNG